MKELIQKKLSELPEAPGIYKMLDANGNIIYIGKSKCLKKRVHSYFVPNPKWEKARRMVGHICDIDIIVTDTHLEAMLLECELIKKIKPFFNSLMKNDRRYSYLTLEENFRKKPLKLTDTREDCSFGLFKSRSKVQDAIDNMLNFYPLKLCEDQYIFEYHLFPYTMNQKEFSENRQILATLFSDCNAMSCFKEALRIQMLDAVERESYERAARYRDFIESLDYIQNRLLRYQRWTKESLIYVVPMETSYKFFLIKDGWITATQKTSEFSRRTVADFIHARGYGVEEFFQKPADEKEMVDYRDIIYSELSGANPDYIISLDCLQDYR